MSGAIGIYGITRDHTFHTAATAAAVGTAFTVGAYKSITVDIDGAPTSSTVAFKCTGANGVAKVIKGLRVSDWTTAVSTTTSVETWQFDVTGLQTIYMDITAIVAGPGSLTIKGRAVA